MEIKKGIAVSPGVAINQAVVLDAEDYRIPLRHVSPQRIKQEVRRLDQAVTRSRQDLAELRDRARRRLGSETAAIFDFHLALLDDRSLQNKIRKLIRSDSVTAEFAVADVLRGYAKEFLQMPEYLADRVKDVYDIEKRILRHLIGQSREDLARLEEEVVVLAHDLTPSQTANLDRRHVLGLATDAGGRTSHTAIVARALGIPAVVGLNDVTASVNAGDTVIIDGNRGVVIINPDEATIRQHRQYVERIAEFELSLDRLVNLPAITLDGHEVVLLGNIEFPHEAATVIAKGGQGIGLYRTEFLYLGREVEPTEEDHYQAYMQVIHEMQGRPLVIRTLDLGADKYTQERSPVPERNPFLGCRSIRFCFQNLQLFKTQLRAILRASLQGDLAIMFPLITSVMELRQSKMILRDVMEDLEEEGIEVRRDVPVGIMVEVPSAALMCNQLAEEVDFFSIGTNDLIQYTLAVDRANERVAPLFTPAHPAVLRLIKEVIRAGQRHDLGVSLCGEMAGQPEYTLLLIGMGLRTLSVAPPAIPEVKQLVRSMTMEHARRVARTVMAFDNDKQIVSYLRDQSRQVMPEAY
ncbi:MAG: phosphoenolpyruvate-protein phosphotransferase [Phycisphaerae bacterium SM23_33]|nr:MAG: phosphoenolpyruvate-protein phosphotransferase [Phycisphaerae bacterium SM23_33]